MSEIERFVEDLEEKAHSEMSILSLTELDNLLKRLKIKYGLSKHLQNFS